MRDTASKSEESLKPPSNIIFNVFRSHPGEECGHNHNGNFDRWKQIHRHLDHARNAHHANDQTDDDNQVGVTDGKSRHIANSSCKAMGSINHAAAQIGEARNPWSVSVETRPYIRLMAFTPLPACQ